MKISIIFPSRGRARKSHETALSWREQAGEGVDLELILSIDRNDPSGDRYKLYHRATADKIVHEQNDCVVQATNKAAAVATGDILLYLSDDFNCFPNWGHAVLKEFEGVTKPRLIKVDDCLQKFNVGVLTIPIMNKELHKLLGYFFHPSYKSMHVDVDLFETCKRLGVIKMCPHIKFPHEHVSNGKATDDDTYRRSARNWDQGLEVITKRRKEHFPV